MTEQLALQQLVGDGGAVDGGEAPLGPRAHAVHRAGQDLLAGPALAGDEHGGVVAGHPARDVQQIAHRLALRHHQILDHAGAQRGAERLDLLAQLLPLLGLPDGHGDFVGAERLVEVVVRAFAHRGERAVFGTVGAHHDEQGRATLAAVAAQEGDPVHLGHPDVAENQVEGLRSDPAERLLGVGLGRHLVARFLQQQRERLAKPGVVVNDQQAHRSYPREAGRL